MLSKWSLLRLKVANTVWSEQDLQITMSKQSGLIIGSIVFLVLGIIAAVVFFIYIGTKSPPQFVSANRKVGMVSVIIATISMWIMWACTYMHQMNPIIQPLLAAKKE